MASDPQLVRVMSNIMGFVFVFGVSDCTIMHILTFTILTTRRERKYMFFQPLKISSSCFTSNQCYRSTIRIEFKLYYVMSISRVARRCVFFFWKASAQLIDSVKNTEVLQSNFFWFIHYSTYYNYVTLKQ